MFQRKAGVIVGSTTGRRDAEPVFAGKALEWTRRAGGPTR
jgi:hypothetical protein